MTNNIALSLITVFLFFAACRKTPPVPKPSTADLIVELDNNYLPNEKADSAYVWWTADGKRVQKNLTKIAGKFSISLDSLTAAVDIVEVRLYTSKLINSHRSMYVKRISKPVNNKYGIVLRGPSSVTDPNWVPRVFMLDGGVGAIAVMGIRPEDTFLGLYNIADKWIDLTVEKIYYKGLSTVAGKLWTCNGNHCIIPNGMYENELYFASVQQQLAGKEYNHIEQLFMFGDGNIQNGWRVLSFTYDFK
ncbi:hypothetical protein IQ13_0818 [Lacibacter cauensis]|uniref:Uncharacterized protein n=1 Tax=Lacibacter cauensis TaxID=510947 RepID=A0A562SWJ0_9BACT|nr:hypothetical protein [Lacibacter cauensis]TWI85655.1 hypothetical protein IQ13_0818 [Lacibacter cauensis]